MIKSSIIVDLPSAQMQNPSGPLVWIAGLFGKRRDVSGQEELTVGALRLLTGIADAFRRAAVTNVISLLVDGQPVYLDDSDVPDDIDAMLAAARGENIADKRFEDMRLAFTHAEQGLHTIIEIVIQNEVVLGTEEMEVELSARIEEFTVQPGESREAWTERVLATTSSAVRMETYRRDLFALTERIAQAIREALPETTVTSAPAHFEIAEPSRDQVRAFDELPFGGTPAACRYNPRPQERLDTTADPFELYFDDPYAALTRSILVDAVVNQGALEQRSTRVLRADGTQRSLRSARR